MLHKHVDSAGDWLKFYAPKPGADEFRLVACQAGTAEDTMVSFDEFENVWIEVLRTPGRTVYSLDGTFKVMSDPTLFIVCVASRLIYVEKSEVSHLFSTLLEALSRA